jgi:hypothetical protein
VVEGFLRPGIGWPERYVRAQVLLPDVSSRWSALDFLIDTGSTASCVHPGDSLLTLHIDAAQLVDVQHWPRHESRGGIGGSAIYYLVRAIYNFRHVDGSELDLDQDLRIAAPTASNLDLPSILGWDVLQDFTFTTDWRTRIVRLES